MTYKLLTNAVSGKIAMSTFERQAHWQNVYQTKAEQTVSWFQEIPDISLDLIHATGVDEGASIIDIYAGLLIARYVSAHVILPTAVATQLGGAIIFTDHSAKGVLPFKVS
jgi:hypothetical protein